MAITLAEITLQARQRADMENSNMVSSGEITSYINNSIAELHDILCEAYGSDYFVLSVDAATDGTETTYALPDDFYELKAVDLYLDGRWVNVPRFNFNERNRYADSGYIYAVSDICYRIVGNDIMFAPAPAATQYRLWYVPVATKLVNPTDELDDMNAYSEYVIVDVAIKMLTKEESDASVFMAQKQALEKRIRDKSQDRDAANAPTITDVSADDYDPIWRRY